MGSYISCVLMQFYILLQADDSYWNCQDGSELLVPRRLKICDAMQACYHFFKKWANLGFFFNYYLFSNTHYNFYNK